MSDSIRVAPRDEGSRYRLYGVPHSLYTGIVRCYLRTQGIPYIELPPSHADYQARIKPLIRRTIVPVVETPTGQVIQDSLEIIRHFEGLSVPYPVTSPTPLRQVLAIVIYYFGTQGLRRHAMHYRWSYQDQQRRFLREAFATGSGVTAAEEVMARMNGYLPMLGVTERTIPAIEQSYTRLLEILERHLAEHPYLLGGLPSLADFGMIGPLFAHLGRDPVPANLMKTQAPRVYRWVERMTAPGLDLVDFTDYPRGASIEDSVPASLMPLLDFIREEIFPELTAKLEVLDAWVRRTQPADGDPVMEKPHQRSIGIANTFYRNIPVTLGVEPYLLYILGQADEVLERCTGAERERVLAFLEKTGLQRALPGRRGYSVARREHIEVWAR